MADDPLRIRAIQREDVTRIVGKRWTRKRYPVSNRKINPISAERSLNYWHTPDAFRARSWAISAPYRSAITTIRKKTFVAMTSTGHNTTIFYLVLQLAITQLYPIWFSSTRINTRPSRKFVFEQSTLVCKFADLKRKSKLQLSNI